MAEQRSSRIDPTVGAPETVSADATASAVPTPPLPAPTCRDGPSPLLNCRIGRYLIQREIAVGGMGSVFEAVQDQPRRLVAIKLLRSGFTSDDHLRRFELEAQLLARLQHPCVAQVFEAGTWSQGGRPVPYIAMEYIPGARTIVEYARLHRLPLRGKLELFLDLCDAVHYGHTKGIVHRDLKPANVLVDSGGRLKVIDFGISRSIGGEAGAASGATESDHLVGTLQYMSPEQCDPSLGDVAVPADVYALGVVLYELVCGRLPYEIRTRDVSQALSTILTAAPVRPSTIDGALRGDAETIMLKALEKSPKRRYASAADLADDVRRLLRGAAVRARGEGLPYLLGTRVKGFVARHQVTAVAASCVVAVIVAQLLGVRLLFTWTPLNRMFENALMRTFVPSLPGGLEHVRLITIPEGLDVEALAARHGVAGVSNADRTSLRRLHGLLMRKLAAARPNSVTFDIAFPDPTPHDAEFVAGVDALAARSTDVVVALRTWQLDAEGNPQLSPVIAPKVKWGGITADLSDRAPWYLVLTVEERSRAPLPSLALATLGAYSHPGAIMSAFVDAPANAIELNYILARRPLATERLQMSGTMFKRVESREMGLKPGARLGQYLLEFPAQEVIEAVRFDYDDVLDADPATLRRWFEGRAVVVGDTRSIGGDGPYLHPSGRWMHGCYAQAVGIDALIRGRGVRVPHTSSVFGLAIVQFWVIDLSAALLGAVIGLTFSGSSGRRSAALAVGAVGLVGLSLFAYGQARYLWNPFVPIIAMVIASELTARAATVRRRRLLLA